MSTAVFPYLNRSQVATPDEGFFSIFYDKDNGNLLTSKSFEGNFQPLATPINIDQSCVCEAVERIINAAACSLEKGMITAEQFESIVDNFNLYFNIQIDPVSGSGQISFTNTETIFISMALVHVDCNGASTGTATPTVTGGTAPYTYDWGGDNPAALAAGFHTLTVTDDNGKTKAYSFIINEPTAITATSSTTPETGGLNNGTATVTPTGGTAPYTYLWDDGLAQTTQTATGLTSGTYSCTITDANDCELLVEDIIVA